jgi:hypothetical protein
MKTSLPSSVRFAAIAAGLLLAFAASARAIEITLPTETAHLADSPLPGAALATAMCYTCHSAEYVLSQPTLARTYWKSTVVKMQKVFGAPLPDSAIEPLTDYLVKTYGTEHASASSPATATSVAPAPGAGK